MNIQNTKKLTSTLLACVLALGGAISVSAAELSNESHKAVASTETIKAVIVSDAVRAENGSKPVQVRLTRIEGATPDDLTVSVVPLAKLVTPLEEKASGEQNTIKAIRLVPAKTMPMEKLIME